MIALAFLVVQQRPLLRPPQHLWQQQVAYEIEAGWMSPLECWAGPSEPGTPIDRPIR